MSNSFEKLNIWIRDKWKHDKTSFSLYCSAFCAVSMVSMIYLGQYVMKRKTETKLQEFETISKAKKKVILHVFKTHVAFPMSNISPACAKLIAYLEYNKIEYIEEYEMPMHPKTHKSPWITWKNDHIPDSNMIIQYFTNDSFLNRPNMDNHLNKLQKSILFAYRAMIEDCLYYIMVYRRWLDKDNVDKYLDLFLPRNLQRKFIQPMIVKQVKRQVWEQGTSRLPPKEIYERGVNCIESIINYMSDKNFFFGDKITTLDLSIYGQIGSMYQMEMKWKYCDGLPFKHEINEYMKRIEIKCFGEVRYWKDIV
eukprot:257989_1